jgi:Fic family protein
MGAIGFMGVDNMIDNQSNNMAIKLSMIGQDLLPQYTAAVDNAVQQQFGQLCDNELSMDTFSFYTSVSAVFSSKIEGEPIELDSYIKHKRLGAHFLPDYTRKTDDLYDAYSFAKQSTLTLKNLLEAHTLLTKHILKKSRQGAVRTGNMFVLTNDGRIEYVAADPQKVQAVMQLLFVDVETLLAAPLSFAEVLYYAAMIHLVFVKIHPFEDGNGRTARLLEKWFMAQKLGDKAWFVQSERYYYEHHHQYYTNIRQLGQEYDSLNYTAALPFLLMLPSSVGMR